MNSITEQLNEIQLYIKDSLVDPWAGTYLDGYAFLHAKQKGAIGERIITNCLLYNGWTVTNATNPGHDRLVCYHQFASPLKAEFKFSAAGKYRGSHLPRPDNFVINHVAAGKDWDILVFLGLNPDGTPHRFFWFHKDAFCEEIKRSDSVFKKQQGGKKGTNDDWICTDVVALLNMNFTHMLTLEATHTL